MYKLKITENKRAVIYVNNKATYTKPFILKEQKKQSIINFLE